MRLYMLSSGQVYRARNKPWDVLDVADVFRDL